MGALFSSTKDKSLDGTLTFSWHKIGDSVSPLAAKNTANTCSVADSSRSASPKSTDDNGQRISVSRKLSGIDALLADGTGPSASAETAQRCDNCRVEGKLLKCACQQAVYCSKRCQSAHWKSHKLSCPPMVLKPAGSGKGYGWFAIRAIKPGTVVFREKVAIVVSPETAAGPVPLLIRSILDQFNALEPFYQRTMLTASYVDEHIDAKYNPLFRCSEGDLAELYAEYGGRNRVRNVVTTTSQRSYSCSAGKVLFLIGQLFNHSCAPNMIADTDYTGEMAAGAVDPAGGGHIGSGLTVEEQLFYEYSAPDNILLVNSALRSIAKGEELTQGYMLYESYAGFASAAMGQRAFEQLRMASSGERTRYLKFTCACEICSLTGDELRENDEIRREIRKVNAEFERLTAELNARWHKFSSAKESKITDFPSNAGDVFTVGDRLLQLLSRIPDQLIQLRSSVLVDLMQSLADAIRAGQVPLMAPGDYKKELLRVLPLAHPVSGLRQAHDLLERGRVVERVRYGGQYLDLF